METPGERANFHRVQIAVLTGMSGAGKHLASRYFEDMRWRVVDNLPPRLLPLIVDEEAESDDTTPFCAVCDVRGGRIDDLIPALDVLSHDNVRPTVIFLDASDETLIHRFKETRRPHPLFEQAESIQAAITDERRLLQTLRERADVVIDTTGLTPSDLRGRLLDAFAPTGALRQHPLTVTVASFGFKHGTPLDVDLMFDVRFLKNPHYDPVLRALDGRHPAIESFVFGDERTAAFLDRLYDLVGWTLPHYVDEGKAYLTIGIGCTGGKHRSVVVAEHLGKFLSDRGYRTLVQHRDIPSEDRLQQGKG